MPYRIYHHLINALNKSLLSLLLLAVAVLAGPARAADPATSADLMPHKALYDIHLKSTTSGSQIINISGQMFYEWKPSCEAWITNHRFNLLYEYADSPPMRVTSDFSTFEAFDGTSLDFVAVRRRDGEVFEEFRGRASMDPDNPEEPGAVVYTEPAGTTSTLPPGTLFPMAHTLKVLDSAAGEDKFVKATIFDGSDAQGPVEVNAFVGDPVNALAHIDSSAGIDPGLLNGPAWQARLAFFPLTDKTGLADYEMDVVLHKNSVVSDMSIEYDDFTIAQKLVALDRLEGGCGVGQTPPDSPLEKETKANE